ncbi:MAG: mannonate dehydratase, partial [Candidatus Saccharibacteria bacterium]|nr:mannonate dehydratase [Pseudorhodobacter sp.]
MKIGLGLYRESLTQDNFQFATQAGATHIVAHMTNYFRGKDPAISRGDDAEGWGDCSQDKLWSYDDLSGLVKTVEAAGLKLAALENLSPKFWSDILLDGPERGPQIEGMKRLIRDAGRAGVPCIGYNFSVAGVWGWQRGPFARGNAHSVGYDSTQIDPDLPMPDGLVWNMRYRAAKPDAVPVRVSNEEIWARLTGFLQEMIPVAAEAGVVLAAHPDDPPAEQLRGAARLVNRPEKYDRLLDIVDSPANAVELCLGSLQEMPGGEIYDHVRRFARRDRIGYIYFRNVKGKVPKY